MPVPTQSVHSRGLRRRPALTGTGDIGRLPRSQRQLRVFALGTEQKGPERYNFGSAQQHLGRLT